MSIILPETQKLIRPLDRKTAVVSLCRTLTDSSAFSEKYRKGWGYTCEALLKLLEIPPVPSTATDDVHEHDVDDPSFGVGFTQLNSCRSTPVDAWPEMTDSKRWVGLALKEADAKHHGRVCFHPFPSGGLGKQSSGKILFWKWSLTSFYLPTRGED